jgi:hypothetical protein
MTGALLKKMLRHAGKAAAGVLSAALLAKLGLPALGALVILAVLVMAVVCWVISSGDRSERASRMLLAGRGNASCLGPLAHCAIAACARAAPLAVAPAAPRPGRWCMRELIPGW